MGYGKQGKEKQLWGALGQILGSVLDLLIFRSYGIAIGKYLIGSWNSLEKIFWERFIEL